jgi:hypothetical protein
MAWLWQLLEDISLDITESSTTFTDSLAAQTKSDGGMTSLLNTQSFTSKSAVCKPTMAQSIHS